MKALGTMGLFVFGVASLSASACIDVRPVGEPPPTLRENAAGVDLIFTAHLLGIVEVEPRSKADPMSPRLAVNFEVKEILKGQLAEAGTVYIGMTSCEQQPMIGKDYVVFARFDSRRGRDRIISGEGMTRPLPSEKEIAELKSAITSNYAESARTK